MTDIASFLRRGFAMAAALCVAAPLAAQDTRHVTEPVVPPACTTITARLESVGDSTIPAADESSPDTRRIQTAIDHCTRGHAVVLAADGARRAFLSGPIQLRAGVTLIVGDGAILLASRNPRDYDIAPGSCGVVSTKGHGCMPLILGEHASGAGVMGPGTIDGRGWATLTGRDISWWGLAEQARSSYRLSQNCPRLLHVLRSDDFTLYHITLRNSPNFHVVFDRGNGFTAWGVVIHTPKDARNTDGIDPASATNVTITHSYISTGDDDVAIKAGGTGASTHMTISHDHFYAGHGMSIGSETNGGASGILVQDLSTDGADNGQRIKSNSARVLGGSTVPLAGDDVRVRGATTETARLQCDERFVPDPRTVSAAAIGVSKYAAVVDARYAGRDGAVVDGTPTFRTLGAAISELPQGGIGRAVVFLRNGRYHEKLDIDRPYLTLLGESRDSTIITYDAAAGEPAPGGGTYGTRGSYTLRVVAPDFRAENLTIENAFDYPANAARPESDSTKLRGSQAVALLLDMSSDRATFVNVKITGYQDTLFPNAGRAYFYRCEIWGNVDFIFGAGRAVFDDCDIVSRDRGSRTNNGYITAPSTPAAQPYGFVFVHSRLRKERPQMAPNSVALGRPWHPYGNSAVNSSAVYVDCWMDDHIGAKGWDRMSSTDSTGARTWNLPEHARFFEYGSTGPGAVASPTRRVLSADEAKRYAPAVVLDGWMPAH